VFERTSRLSGFVTSAALLCVALAAASCSQDVKVEKPPGGVPEVRVLLLDTTDEIEVEIGGPYEIALTGGGEDSLRVAKGERLPASAIRCLGTDIVIEDVIRTPRTIELVPSGTAVEVGGGRYRGSLRISSHQGKVRIINVVDMESYLRGVVPAEILPGSKPPALRAQAIAARSYAIARMRSRAARVTLPFDLYATQQDQVYAGLNRETEETNAAVAATAGQVLTYRGRVVTAYYHATCGGMTADARYVFGDSSPALRGTDCHYCKGAPGREWTVKISSRDLAAKLGQRAVSKLTIQRRGLDGRATQVTIHRPGGGTPPVMAGSVCRRRLGLRSTRFGLKTDGRTYVFKGSGYGHGVGMCQWGAMGLAKEGADTERILDHYYRGAGIVKEY